MDYRYYFKTCTAVFHFFYHSSWNLQLICFFRRTDEDEGLKFCDFNILPQNFTQSRDAPPAVWFVKMQAEVRIKLYFCCGKNCSAIVASELEFI